MLRLLPMTLALLGVLRLLRLHLAIANDKGSPTPDAPFEVEKITSSKALYGQLSAEKPYDYYTFEAEAGTNPQAILLIPAKHYQQGLRATFRLTGPGLPEGAAIPKSMESAMHIAGTDYVMVRSYAPALPETGCYSVVVEREAGTGTYAMCLGSGEGNFKPDPETRAKVAALLQI